MIAHTRQFPTRPNITNMESTVVIATPANSDMIEDCPSLNKNKPTHCLFILTTFKCKEAKNVLLYTTDTNNEKG